MREVVLDRHDLNLLQVEAELCQAPFDALPVAEVAAVAGEDRIQCAVGCIPVALRIMPARLLGQADRRKGDGHDVDVGRFDAGELKAELRCFVGHAVLRVLVADEAFFLCGRHQLAVDVEGGGGIVRQCAGKSKYSQCQNRVSCSRLAGGLPAISTQVYLSGGILRQIRCLRPAFRVPKAIFATPLRTRCAGAVSTVPDRGGRPCPAAAACAASPGRSGRFQASLPTNAP